MKKVLLSILVLLTVFTITGCGRKYRQINNNVETNKPIEDTRDKLIINGYDLTLNEESSFVKIKFKYPHDAIISNPITTLIMDYKKPNSNESLVRVVMGEMYGTSIDKSVEGFTKEGTKTINGIEWGIYTKDGRKSYGFNIDYSNILIGFIYDDANLAKFEEEFMNNVTLIDENKNTTANQNDYVEGKYFVDDLTFNLYDGFVTTNDKNRYQLANNENGISITFYHDKNVDMTLDEYIKSDPNSFLPNEDKIVDKTINGNVWKSGVTNDNVYIYYIKRDKDVYSISIMPLYAKRATLNEVISTLENSLYFKK